MLVPQWRYRVHRWEVTETAVYTQTGWWARERRIAPMSRIQTVDYAEGAIARLFGLATVTVTTASRPARSTIEGLDQHRALQLVDELTLKADTVAGRRDVTAHRMDARDVGRAGSGSTRGCCWSTRSASWSGSCPSLIGIFVAGPASDGELRGRLLGVADPDRARPAALPDDAATGSPRAGSSCAAGCSTGTCSPHRSTGSAPSTSPPRRSTACSA